MPPAKGNSRNELLSHADARPRLFIRLVDNAGAVGIAYRTHPAARERVAGSIELAMHAALPNATDRAVLIWDGLHSSKGDD